MQLKQAVEKGTLRRPEPLIESAAPPNLVEEMKEAAATTTTLNLASPVWVEEQRHLGEANRIQGVQRLAGKLVLHHQWPDQVRASVSPRAILSKLSATLDGICEQRVFSWEFQRAGDDDAVLRGTRKVLSRREAISYQEEGAIDPPAAHDMQHGVSKPV